MRGKGPLGAVSGWIRWALGALLLVIVAAIVLLVQNASVMRRQLDDDFNQQQLVLARQAAAAIEHRVADVEAEASSLAHLLAGLDLPRRAVEVASDATLHRCRDLAVTSVRLVAADGTVTLVRGRPLLPEVPQPGHWPGGTPAVVGATVVGPRVVARTEGGPWRVADQVTALMGGAEIQAVILDVDLTALIGGVARHIRSGKSGYLWVLDGRGAFLYHPDGAFVGRNAFEVRRRRAPEIDFRPIDRIMRERMLRGEEGVGSYVSGWHGGMAGRIPKLIAFAPLHGPGAWEGEIWSVAVVAPESEVAGAAHRVFRRHVAAVGVLVAALVLVLAVLGAASRRSEAILKRRVARTEAELHELERISRRVVEQASDMIYILDPEGRIVLANQPTVRLFQWLSAVPRDAPDGEHRPEYFLGRSVNEILPPGDARFLMEKLDLALFCGHGISYEHSVRVDGERRRLSTRLMPIREDTGGVRWLLGITRDISEKVALDQRLYNAEKLASIGTLAAGVAHEINNPLAVILGFSELLRERLPEGSQEYEDVLTIEDQATAAKRVVESLLGFARVTEGLEDTVEVAVAVRQVVTVVANTLMTRKVELGLEIEDGLPRVRGDAREFQQVVFNLVTNAVTAMGDTGGRLTIAARREEDWVAVEVRDTGPGIPERIRPRIFDPFFTTKPVGQGTGLGLSLCYGIVRRYGGTISCTSVSAEDHPNQPTGTTFTIRLPVAEETPGKDGS